MNMATNAPEIKRADAKSNNNSSDLHFTETEEARHARLTREAKQRTAKEVKYLKGGDWMGMARQFVGEGREVLHWREDFYFWGGSYWEKATKDDVNTVLYGWLDRKKRKTKSQDESGEDAFKKVPFKPKKHDVQELTAALAATVHLSDSLEPPYWRNGRAGVEPADLLLFNNGTLNLRTGDFYRPDPDLFCLAHVDCEYNPNAEAPAWTGFLESLFPEEPETRLLIEEMIGYSLSMDRTQQKVFMLLGPPRSGKGTIGRVIKKLVGPNQYVGPTVASFASKFGMQQLINKSVACVADARSGRGHDPYLVVERLLTISGQDHVTIDRKWQSHWNGMLPTQIWWMSNEEPKFSDASGAIVTRLILVQLTQSFLGREDPLLTDKLLAELPGIANRALAGLNRLRERGSFIQPKGSAETLRQIEQDAHPVRTWLDDCCEVQPNATVFSEDAYQSYDGWCKVNGHKVSSAKQFGKDLRASIPALTRKRETSGRRRWYYTGLKLMDKRYSGL